ncbi:anhydro-N-acetylmuramic acid kinase [Virgibacillus soli]|uniref:anhydro-N-acetylmuramic acid kinase n=1 Tax=Paracerasibacillus soli TaxID=480284 RepID=UPI0035EA5C1F
MKDTCYAVGLMSGTSLDGIDAAVVKITETEEKPNIQLVHFLSSSYSQKMKEEILALCDPQKAKVEDISTMNMLLGEMFAEAALKAIHDAKLLPEDILFISSHGQTIFHQPKPKVIAGKDITSTLQIGDIGVIAEVTGITTVGDFRTRDMAAGGQGAPLVPFADYLLFKEKEYGRVLVNIGGISNFTILPKDCQESDVIAYDTGPGNMIIDAFVYWATEGMQTYDKDGARAAAGNINEEWLQELLQHEYYGLPYPKSTGREMFGTEYARALWEIKSNMHVNDKIATVTDLTAKSIAQEIRKHADKSNIKEVLISGGGRYNQTLMERIAFHLPKGITVAGTEKYGMSADAKEAITFALLGYQCYYRKTNNLPTATGATKPVVMGKIAW